MKTKLLVVFCMVFALLTSAFAVTVSDVSLDIDDAVERSNPLLEGNDNELDGDDELEYVSFSIPVEADTADITVTGATLDSSFTYATLSDDNTNDDIFIITSSLPFTVANGSTKDLVVKVLVPSNLDAIDSAFNDLEHSVEVDVETNESTETAVLSFYVDNGLELSDVEISTPDERIECDVEDDSTDLDCDDEIEELSPTEDFTLSFVIENIFDSDSGLDLEDVEIEVESDNNDVDPEDDSFDEDIDADDEVSFTIDFEVDDAEDGDDVSIIISAYGEDENGAAHGFEYEFTGDFELPDYEVQLTSTMLSPSAICQGELTKITFDVENIGGKDQNNVRIQAKSNALGLDQVLDRIELEDEDSRDNDYQGEFVIETESSTKADQYDIELIVYYRDEDSNDATLFDRLSVVVQDCEGDDSSSQNDGSTNQPTTQTPVVVVQQPVEPTIVQQPTQTNQPVTAVVSKKGELSTWGIVGLVLVILIVLGLIAALVAILRK